MGATSRVREVSSSAGRGLSSFLPQKRLAAVPSQVQPSRYAIPDWSKRIPALDGLRGIAILMVLMRHSIFGMETNSKILLPFLAAGQLTWSGVDLFFVLSGFLIGGILLDAKHSPCYFKTFYIRRAYRIFPLYFLVTGLFLFRHLPFHLLPGSLGAHSPLSIPWGAYLTLTQNFWMAHSGWFGMFAMAPTWSLAVEEQFYLTIPLVIRYFNSRQLVTVLISVVAADPLLRVLLQYHFPHGEFACYVLTPCRADALSLGVLAAVLVRNPAGWQLLMTKRGWLRGALGLLLAGVIYMTWQRYDPFTAPMNTFGFSWMALFYTICLLAAISGSNGSLPLRVLCNQRLMGLGSLAYCAYLIHAPMIIAGRRIFSLIFRVSDLTSWLPGGLIGIAATILIASISWKFFEKPLLRMGHKHTY